MSEYRYRLWRPERSETEDDGRIVSGCDAQSAIQEWAARDDARSADYNIVGGTPAVVMVRNLQNGAVSEWIVSGEVVAVYSAHLRMKHNPKIERN